MNKATIDTSVFSAQEPRLFSISAGRPFLLDLAEGIVAASRADDFSLYDAQIFLPTRRAVRGLIEAFRRISAGPTLLPRIQALGEVDGDETVAGNPEISGDIDTPPALSPLERQFILARFVAAKDRSFAGQERWPAALSAARELGKLLDSLYTEEIETSAFADLVPANMAAHWAHNLRFLEIVTQAWPDYLRESKKLDPSERRIRLLDIQNNLLAEKKPNTPIIIAGTTGSTPAVARLMKTVLTLEKGCVVLPGVDLQMDTRHWAVVDDPHPQSGLKSLLEDKLEFRRPDVKPWPSTENQETKFRDEVLSVALRPAAASDSWHSWSQKAVQQAERTAQAFTGLELYEAENEDREADGAAVRIRLCLEEKNKTVMLVTPDRDLARRVAAKLRRWSIIVDDSGGIPFGNTPCGIFIRLTARWIAEPNQTSSLLALLRNPYFHLSLDSKTRELLVETFDLTLRGVAPIDPLGALENDQRARAKIGDPLTQSLEAFRNLWDGIPQNVANFERWVDIVIDAAETLAASPETNGAERLWNGPDGEAGAAALAEIRAYAASLPGLGANDAASVLDQLLQSFTVRPNRAAHPRVSILGPLEARLQSADLVILGGLNEGVWPREAAIDPFLSRSMRSAIGLPSPEQRIGLAAHDFAQLSAAPNVMLTRAKKSGGKPSNPSRWIVRLTNIAASTNSLAAIDCSERYEFLAARLNDTELERVPLTAPTPPVEARPTSFFVTRIGKLIRDPYAVYAHSILGLRKLSDIEEPVDTRHLGILFHRIFETFLRAEQSDDRDMSLKKLNGLFKEYAPEAGLGPEHVPFWRQRANDAFAWFIDWNAQRLALGSPVVIEGQGKWKFDHDGRTYTLSARADRIDLLHSGSLAIFDYKTTEPPPTALEQSKFTPQLPLTALIATQGGFGEIGKKSVESFAYIRVLNRTGKKDDVVTDGDKCQSLIEESRRGLLHYLSYFNQPGTSYHSQPRPKFTDDYGDYDQLARRKERLGMGGDE